MKEILFVCLAAKNRSPTGARIFNENFQKEGSDYHASCVGVETNCNDDAIRNAYRVISVNWDVTKVLRDKFSDISERLREMEIPDCYPRDHEDLCNIFNEYYDSGQWQ